MLHYILQTIAFQLFFLIIYDVFLKKETFFNWNRFYLLITAITSIVLPFIKFESIRTIVPEQFVIRLPEVIIGNVQPVTANVPIEITSEMTATSNFIWSWDYLLYAGMILAGLLLVYKIIKLSVLIRNNPKRWKGNLVIINLLKSNAAFSFFHYVFLGEWIKEEEKEAILKHELVHVSQKHSLDLLLFEVLRILFWFNPLIYMYQSRITTLHEYIADAQAMKQSDKKQYYEKLLSQVFDTESISFTNTFFNQSLIKKRIVMLSKSKSNRSHLLKYALLIPMVFGMLVYTSAFGQESNEDKISQVENANQEMTLQELTEKYYQELVKISKNQGIGATISKNYIPKTDKYINTKDEVARHLAFFKYLAEGIIEKKRRDGTLTNEDIERNEEMLTKYKTYEDYLAYQKTDKAKSNWESNIRDGVLRLVVDDMKNLTEIEKKKQEGKINLIEKDDFFHSLLMTDGKSSSLMEIHAIDGKEISHPNKNTETANFDSYDLEVPFSIIDEVPTIEECKDLATNDEKRQCLSDYISDFVNKNFNINIAKEFGLTGRQRISVMFKIGKDGNVQNVLARAPHPALEAEAKRVISKLPQMIPGKQKGEAVVVPYSLPILFQVQGDDISTPSYEEFYNKSKATDASEVPFSIVDVPPTFADCEDWGKQEDIRICTSLKISEYVNANFNKKIAKESGLTGKQRISVMFKITKDGTINDIKVRAPHPALEAEAIRVIKALPPMLPGKQRGQTVVVPYSLPIIFQVSE